MLKNILVFLSVLLLVHAAQVTVEVQMTNLAPINGANLTPLWVGFHDGSFDTFNFGDAASARLERVAEDGDTAEISVAFLNSNSDFIDATIVADNSEVPVVQFQQTATQQFTIDSDEHEYVSLLSMVVPSNDAFVGNSSPTAYRLFDDDEFSSLTVTWTNEDVYDAGTEENDEIPENTAFFGQVTPNTGVNENGEIDNHPGLLPASAGGIVADPNFVNADFSQNGYTVGRVTIRLVDGTNDDDDNNGDDDNGDDDDASNNDDDDNNGDDDNNDDDDNGDDDDFSSGSSSSDASSFSLVFSSLVVLVFALM